MKIGFIGAGNMATAIIKSLFLAKSEFDILAYDLDKNKLDILSKYGVSKCENEKELSALCDFVVLAVKPQNFQEVLNGIKDSINKNAVVISIAAGISAQYIKSMLGFDAKVVPVMPNTPLMLGEGATALAKVSPVTDDEFNVVRKVFDSAGITAEIDETKMCEIIPINGSSPAFIYAFAKSFIDYAHSVGIDDSEAKRLFAQTLIGSAKMITDSGNTLEELIKMVSSKGGTTIAGLTAFDDKDLNQTVFEACKRCTNRAYELSK